MNLYPDTYTSAKLLVHLHVLLTSFIGQERTQMMLVCSCMCTGSLAVSGSLVYV